MVQPIGDCHELLLMCDLRLNSSIGATTDSTHSTQTDDDAFIRYREGMIVQKVYECGGQGPPESKWHHH